MISNQKGLTLIEMLVTIVLFSIIGTVAYSFLLNGLNTEKRVHTEALIRDEADLIMSQIINDLYTVPSSKIKDVSNETQNILSYEKEGMIKTVGFIGSEAKMNTSALHTNAYDLTGSKISIEGNSIRILLKVRSTKNEKAKPLSLNSQFGLLGGGK